MQEIMAFGLLSGIILGIIFLLAGISGILTGRKTRGTAKREFYQEFVPLFLLVSGGAGIVSYFFKNSFGGVFCGLFVPGVLIMCIPLYERKLIKLCRTPVAAKCIDYIRHPGIGVYGFSRLAPVFEYTYSGITYRIQTPVEYILEKRFMNRYQIGEIYQIWIDGENPGCCVERKRMPLYRYGWLLGGIMFIGLFLIILLIELPPRF